jgi:hypothetical protein
MKLTNVALALAAAALGWGYYQYRQVRQLAERLDNTRTSHYRFSDQVRETVEGLENEIRTLKAQLRARSGGPAFTAETTIGEAVAIDPRVSQVLSGFHIGGCDSCAVSDTDTLAYAAAGNGQEIEQVLAALNKLTTTDGSKVMEMLERKPNVQIQL